MGALSVGVRTEVLCGRICDLEAENDKLRELLLDCWDFSHLMHGAMAARFYELGLIDDGEARELGVEVQK